MSTFEYDKYFGASTGDDTSSVLSWRSAYTRIVDLMDTLSPDWRKRSAFVGDALHQEIADVFRRVKRSDKERALIKARNAVSQLERDLEAARKALVKAEGLL